jgi:UDP-glucose 4-epimerase
VFGDGSNTRDFIYVGDVVDFCRFAIEEDVKNTVLNMGTGTGTSIIELINLGARLLRTTPKIAYKQPRPGEIGNFVADTRKLGKAFGSRTFTPLEKGLMKTFSWLESSSS